MWGFCRALATGTRQASDVQKCSRVIVIMTKSPYVGQQALLGKEKFECKGHWSWRSLQGSMLRWCLPGGTGMLAIYGRKR